MNVRSMTEEQFETHQQKQKATLRRLYAMENYVAWQALKRKMRGAELDRLLP